MSRVSQEELYNDKDVVTQILKLKDAVNDYAGGIIENIDVSGNDLVIDWASGESISLPLPNPTGISSIAGSISGTNLTITIYMTDGSSHAFTAPLNGIATESYVDTKDAQNVKLTGAQTVAGVKTFDDSPIVPTEPDGNTSAVNKFYVNDSTGIYSNNLLHKDGDESKTGKLTLKGSNNIGNMNVFAVGSATATGNGWYEIMRTKPNVNTTGIHVHVSIKDIFITGTAIKELKGIWRAFSATPQFNGYAFGTNAVYTVAAGICVTINHDGTFSLFALKNGTYSKLVIYIECVDNKGIPADPTAYFDVMTNSTVGSKPVVDNVNYDYVADGDTFSYLNGVQIV